MGGFSLSSHPRHPFVRLSRLRSHWGGGRARLISGLGRPGRSESARCPDTRSGRAALGKRLEPAAQLVLVAAELLEPRQRRQALQAEDPLEQGRHPVANRAADPGFPAALDRALEQASACLGRFSRGAKGPASRDALEHDPAAALAVAILEQPERRFDPFGRFLGGLGQIVRRERLRRHDEQRLERPRERVERTRRDQAERALHASTPSSPPAARATRIGANGAACSSETSPARRSSSSARNATACSSRERPATSCSKSNRRRRRSKVRNCSRNCETGGNRKARCESDTCGGSAASARSAAASATGSCGASRLSPRGASGAGPSRKNRSRSLASRSASHSAAALIRRYSSSRRASSSPAPSGSRSSSSYSFSNRARAFSSSSAATRTRNSPHASRSSSSRSASRSQNATTTPDTSTSTSGSSSRRTRVRSRSNGPSNASRSRSSSWTLMAGGPFGGTFRKLTRGPDAALGDGHPRPARLAPVDAVLTARPRAPEELPPDEERGRADEDDDRDPRVQP